MATFVFEVGHEFFRLVFKRGRAIIACEYSCFSLFLTARDVSPGGTSAPQRQNFHTYSCKICPEFGQELWLVDIVVILFYLLIMHDRQKATKIECKPGCKCDELACIASVSNRVITRKLERKQKKKVEGGGGGEKRKRLPANPMILENAPWYFTVRFIVNWQLFKIEA